jgi:uncharacterized protein YjbI with pentapeptide repeats
MNVMANQEHLAKLREGVGAWNEWRKENPGLQPDLQGADLREADLSNAQLQKANLWNAQLQKTFLQRAQLQGSQHFFLPKSPLSRSFNGGRSGKRSNSGKATREKRLSVPYRRAFHGQDTFFVVPWTRTLTVKASFSFQEALASLKMRFLAGILGGKNVGTPYWNQSTGPQP